MKPKFLVAAAFVGVALAVSGCAAVLYWQVQSTIDESVRALKLVATRDLHDPESARFRSVQLQSLEGPIGDRLKSISGQFLWRSTPREVLAVFAYDPANFTLCGELNAKNGFGAYVGYKRFYVHAAKEPVAFIDVKDSDSFAKKMCEIGNGDVIYSEPDRN